MGCRTCRAINCSTSSANASPYRLYSLQSEVYPFVLNCPPGYDCEKEWVDFETETGMYLTLVACDGVTLKRWLPAGSTLAQRNALIGELVAEAALKAPFCAPPNDGGSGGGGGSGDDGVDDQDSGGGGGGGGGGSGDTPTNPPMQLYYNSPQSCADPETNFRFYVEAGRFFSPSQYLADHEAIEYACSQARQYRFGLLAFNPLCALNQPVEIRLIATGGPRFSNGNTWVIQDDALPPGLVFAVNPNNDKLAVIRGTPTQGGITEFNLTVVNNESGIAVQKAVTLYVLELSPGSVPDTMEGEPYNVGAEPWLFTLNVSLAPGQALYGTTVRYSIASGALPENLNLSANGYLSSVWVNSSGAAETKQALADARIEIILAAQVTLPAQLGGWSKTVTKRYCFAAVDLGDITPDILTGDVAYWNEAEDLPKGRYRVLYQRGALDYNVGGSYTLGDITPEIWNPVHSYWDGTEQPGSFSIYYPIAYWNNGEDLPAGNYRITYKEGATAFRYTYNKPPTDPTYSVCRFNAEYQITTPNSDYMGGYMSDWFLGYENPIDFQSSEALAEAANDGQADCAVQEPHALSAFTHYSGKIGVIYNNPIYALAGTKGVKFVLWLIPQGDPSQAELIGSIEIENASRDAVWFNDGEDLPAGEYWIDYVCGAVNNGVDYTGTTYPNMWAVNALHGFTLLYDAAPQFNGLTGAFSTQAEAESEHAGKYIDIVHPGGPLGMYLKQGDYPSFMAGYDPEEDPQRFDGDPNPTFTLTKL